tara:strand:+ start:3651 stop:3845 length:195 start_codon:yes stop_codon:yes gene_type:complete
MLSRESYETAEKLRNEMTQFIESKRYFSPPKKETLKTNDQTTNVSVSVNYDTGYPVFTVHKKSK